MEAAGDESRVAVAESGQVQRGADLRVVPIMDPDVGRDVRAGRRWGFFIGRVKRRAFVVYLGCNMLTAAVVFFWDAQPRETVSGLLGRWKVKGGHIRRAVALPLAWAVDRIYWWEPDHCVTVYREELAARRQLYQDWPHP